MLCGTGGNGSVGHRLGYDWELFDVGRSWLISPIEQSYLRARAHPESKWKILGKCFESCLNTHLKGV